jgi:hypothetical protein
VRPTLGQRHHPHLRVSRAVIPGPGVPELRGVVLGIGHIDVEPVDRQQPPPTHPRPPSEHPTHRLGHTLEHLSHQLATQPFTGLGDPTGGRHRPRRVPASPRRQRPGDLGRDLLIVILGEQAQRHRQVRPHMRGQLPTRTLGGEPARRDRHITHIPRNSRHQHTQRPLIRTNHHTLIHSRGPCHEPGQRSARHAAANHKSPAQTL